MVTDNDRRWADSMAAAYEQCLVPAVFAPFAAETAKRIAARRPARLLELAAGTGVLTRELASVDGIDVVATDLNPPMVELGRTLAPGAAWQQADAMDLPFPDRSFDLVACQFGVMFLPDKVAAFNETRRLLAPDGAFVFTTWDVLDGHDFERAFVDALTRLFPDDPPRFLESVPHGYADVSRVADDVRAAGFASVAIETITVSGSTSAADLAFGYCNGTPIRAELEARGDLASITRTMTKMLEADLGIGPVTGSMSAHLAEATV